MTKSKYATGDAIKVTHSGPLFDQKGVVSFVRKDGWIFAVIDGKDFLFHPSDISKA